MKLTSLRVNVRQFRIKTRWGITGVSFGLTYHFPDLHHLREKSAETLGRKYSIFNLPKNIVMSETARIWIAIIWVHWLRPYCMSIIIVAKY